MSEQMVTPAGAVTTESVSPDMLPVGAPGYFRSSSGCLKACLNCRPHHLLSPGRYMPLQAETGLPLPSDKSSRKLSAVFPAFFSLLHTGFFPLSEAPAPEPGPPYRSEDRCWLRYRLSGQSGAWRFRYRTFPVVFSVFHSDCHMRHCPSAQL